MREIQFKIALAVLLLMSAGIRLYYQSGRREFEKVVIKHERREKFLVSLFALGLIPILFYVLTFWLDPFSLPLPSGFRWIGTGIIFAGNLLFIWSHRTLGSNWSPFLEIRKGHTLVIDGPYKFIRHPMYAAIFLRTYAFACLAGNFLIFSSFNPKYILGFL